MTRAFINRIATAVPPYDVHQAFIEFGSWMLRRDARKRTLFHKLADRSEIAHRYSYLAPGDIEKDEGVAGYRFYDRGNFPSTAQRMRVFETYAPKLAQIAIDRLELGDQRKNISHLIITCCTGFSAPGLDFEIMARNGLSGSVERSIIGFMGCYAAMNGLKLARHIVRSEPAARVLVVNLELCSLHLQETDDLEEVLSFLIFSDGCAASLISAEPQGIEMESFRAVLLPGTRDLIQWNVGDTGFEMVLSGKVPAAIQTGLRASAAEILNGGAVKSIDLWAVHPGGRTVLDAVERGLDLRAEQLAASREVLRRFGNMSSATIMFVLERLLRETACGLGCAMSFGPGLAAETMLFRKSP